MLLWGTFALWLANRMVHSKDTLRTLFTTWPGVHRKEFIVWMSMSAVVAGGLYLLLRVETTSSILARRHEIAKGTFTVYKNKYGDHGNFYYCFVVQGRQYHGYGSSDAHQLQNIEAGEPFEVYYDPTNPNINTVSEPTRTVVVMKITVTFFGGLIMGMLAIITRKLGALMRASSSTSVFIAHS